MCRGPERSHRATDPAPACTVSHDTTLQGFGTFLHGLDTRTMLSADSHASPDKRSAQAWIQPTPDRTHEDFECARIQFPSRTLPTPTPPANALTLRSDFILGHPHTMPPQATFMTSDDDRFHPHPDEPDRSLLRCLRKLPAAQGARRTGHAHESSTASKQWGAAQCVPAPEQQYGYPL